MSKKSEVQPFLFHLGGILVNSDFGGEIPFPTKREAEHWLAQGTSSVPAAWVLCTVSILVVKCLLNMEDDFS